MARKPRAGSAPAPVRRTFDPACPPRWALRLAEQICEEEFARTGVALNPAQVVYGFAGARPAPGDPARA